ncbi:nitrate- and nitrite sensing domain-containing protein [Nocardia sp. NPDC057668]|uniref:sensor histidine kinase n=1 Tax=Nocardia sp. NPDC057668 TaxID=3346202 RepID=UPI00366BD09E
MFKAKPGVRVRILAIALVPSLTLLGVGVGTTGYLVSTSRHDEEWASKMLDGIAPVSELVAAIQQERQVTLWIYAGSAPEPGALAAARQRVDSALRQMNPTEDALRALGREDLKDSVGDLNLLEKLLGGQRTAFDAGAVSLNEAYAFYGRLPDMVILGTRMIQDQAPNAESAGKLNLAAEALTAQEALNRANALAASLAGDGGLPDVLAAEYQRLVGYAHSLVENFAKDLSSDQAQGAQRLLQSMAWKRMTGVESALLQRADARRIAAASGLTGSAMQALFATPLPVSTQEWQDAVTEVSTVLTGFWNAHNHRAQTLAIEAAKATRGDAMLAGTAVLLLAAGAIAVALLLADRIIRRLRRLRNRTLALANTGLPEVMRRLRAGETVEPAAEVAVLNFGDDEIGQVADAFGHAHTIAISAAVTEARTRGGVESVVLNIAHRSQVMVHRQLEILDDVEASQEDPALLEVFFRLDHLVTRERRNAENLIILAGGQPGRQWRQPVSLMEVVRSGVGETIDYTRSRITRMPDVAVAGTVVADLLHLLAELIDNAVAFSPPKAPVEIIGTVVGKGVAIEIIDQGVGLPASEKQRLDHMLSTPPDFGVHTLFEDSRLGLFVVARLAARHGIVVRLGESDYGGVRAVVLVPSRLVVAPTQPANPPKPASAQLESVAGPGQPAGPLGPS